MLKEGKKCGGFSYSEEEMADAFQQFMNEKRGLPGIGRFSRVFREIDCQQGRPDFIALSRTHKKFLTGNTITVKLAGSLVLSLLHENAMRTPEYLARHSGLSIRSVESALSELLVHKYVKRSASGAYFINSGRSLRAIEVVAIELKLDRPRRALFQAQQARSFAQQVLIVVPPRQAKLYEKYAVALRRWGIGLATFEPQTLEFSVCRAPRTSRPRSRQHQAYAMFQLLHDSKS
jgi:hypothetical protein